MSRAKRNLLVSGATLFAMVVPLLLYSGISNLVSAQIGSTPAPTSTLKPTVTPVAAAMPTQPQPISTPDTVTYKDLVEHFERVAEFTLKIIGTVVTLLGIFGIVAGYFSLKTIRDLEKLVDGIEKRMQEIELKFPETQNMMNATIMQATTLTNRYRYMVELRDRNPEVRIRAAQQLGASNDISAVSLLVELLEADKVADVKIEAAYGLGQLLSGGGEPRTLAEGIQALVEGTRDENDEVRREAVESLDTIVCSKVRLPRAAIQRLREIVKHDKSEDVVEATKIALEHIKQQREGSLNAQEEGQESQ